MSDGYQGLQTFGMKAAAALEPYHIVRMTAARTVNVGSLATQTDLVGVVQGRPSSGEMVAVADFGESKVVAGAAITAGALLTTNGSGRAVAATSGQMAIGRALQAAGADGEIITARIWPAMRLGSL